MSLRASDPKRVLEKPARTKINSERRRRSAIAFASSSLIARSSEFFGGSLAAGRFDKPARNATRRHAQLVHVRVNQIIGAAALIRRAEWCDEPPVRQASGRPAAAARSRCRGRRPPLRGSAPSRRGEACSATRARRRNAPASHSRHSSWCPAFTISRCDASAVTGSASAARRPGRQIGKACSSKR